MTELDYRLEQFPTPEWRDPQRTQEIVRRIRMILF